MNYLAHVFLSFGEPEVTLGNFMADHVKGRHFDHLPGKIPVGIRLHREIDTFSDHHPIAKKSSKRLHPHHHHYSQVIVDIYYDHFLAMHWGRYHTVALPDFARDFYRLVGENGHLLPERARSMVPFMVRDDWLNTYASLEGLERVFAGLDRRTNGRANMLRATDSLRADYRSFETEFFAFFAELVTFSRLKLTELCDYHR